MNYADAALLRDGNCKRRLGDGVHRRGTERNLQPDTACELR